jgi:hypothetical protein
MITFKQFLSEQEAIPDTIMVSGKERPTRNSLGKLITTEGIKAIENFWKWFGDSKTVDKDGRPLVLYHGTKTSFDEFDPDLANSKAKTGVQHSTFFSTNLPAVASSYTVAYQGDFITTYHEGGNVMPVYMKISKPSKVNAKGENWDDILYDGDYMDVNTIIGIIKGKNRYDGVIISNIKDKGVGNVTTNKKERGNTYVTFSSNQIKSAIGNNGNFSSTSNKITESN